MKRKFLILFVFLLPVLSCYREEPSVAHLTVQLRLDDAPVVVDLTQLAFGGPSDRTVAAR